MPQVALTIAGFDPSSGAGITADLAVFAAHGLYGTACITAITVQSTRGVRSVQPMDDNLVRDVLLELHADLPPAGIKIGMLATESIVAVVSDFVEDIRTSGGAPVVLDPVLRSSSGHPLLASEALTMLRERLLPIVDCVTPNREELALLLGRAVAGDAEAMEEAARDLQERSGSSLAVIVTGGSLDPPNDLVLAPFRPGLWLRGEHVATHATHGTGCAFSSALLASLVQGETVESAAKKAKCYVEEAMRRAPGLGVGNGPLAHLWPLQQRP